eukprot:gene26904-4518_t
MASTALEEKAARGTAPVRGTPLSAHRAPGGATLSEWTPEPLESPTSPPNSERNEDVAEEISSATLGILQPWALSATMRRRPDNHALPVLTMPATPSGPHRTRTRKRKSRMRLLAFSLRFNRGANPSAIILTHPTPSTTTLPSIPGQEEQPRGKNVAPCALVHLEYNVALLLPPYPPRSFQSSETAGPTERHYPPPKTLTLHLRTAPLS